jgi:hypothetical protein
MPHVFVRLMLKTDVEWFQESCGRIHRHGDILWYGYLVSWGTPYAQMVSNEQGVLTPHKIRKAFRAREGRRISNRLSAEINAGKPVYLFAYHPEAAKRKLVIANVTEAAFVNSQSQPLARERSTQYDLLFHFNAFMRVADRYMPRIVSNLVYADESHPNYGSDLILTDLGPFPVLVDEKIPANHFDPPDPLKVIPAREASVTPEIHYKHGHRGTKYGKPIHNFFQRIIDKVPSVTRIQVCAEIQDNQTDFFSTDKARFDVIRGGKRFKRGNKSFTLAFMLFTTCRNIGEQEILLRYLQDNF